MSVCPNDQSSGPGSTSEDDPCMICLRETGPHVEHVVVEPANHLYPGCECVSCRYCKTCRRMEKCPICKRPDREHVSPPGNAGGHGQDPDQPQIEQGIAIAVQVGRLTIGEREFDVMMRAAIASYEVTAEVFPMYWQWYAVSNMWAGAFAALCALHEQTLLPIYLRNVMCVWFMSTLSFDAQGCVKFLGQKIPVQMGAWMKVLVWTCKCLWVFMPHTLVMLVPDRSDLYAYMFLKHFSHFLLGSVVVTIGLWVYKLCRKIRLSPA